MWKENLKKYREFKQKTQKQLADDLGIDQRVYNKLESTAKFLRPDIAEKLSVMGCSLDFIYRNKDKAAKYPSDYISTREKFPTTREKLPTIIITMEEYYTLKADVKRLEKDLSFYRERLETAIKHCENHQAELIGLKKKPL